MSTPRSVEQTAGNPALPASLRLGPVHLTVADLDRSLSFYEGALGLRVHEREGAQAVLGAGGEGLLVLVADPRAEPLGHHAGLFHVALLSESREQLAHAALRLGVTDTRLDGASDHGVSEALYLTDPDGNGIELSADRPRSAWPRPDGSGTVGIFTAPLDLDGLLALVAGQEPQPNAGPGLTVGHVHLSVSDIDRARSFYRDVIGFELMAELGSALFLAAGAITITSAPTCGAGVESRRRRATRSDCTTGRSCSRATPRSMRCVSVRRRVARRSRSYRVASRYAIRPALR